MQTHRTIHRTISHCIGFLASLQCTVLARAALCFDVYAAFGYNVGKYSGT